GVVARVLVIHWPDDLTQWYIICVFEFFFLLVRGATRSTLFPYTTLFRSRRVGREAPSFGVRWLPPWKICGRSLLRPWRARIVERLLEWQAGGTKGQPKRYDRCTTRRQSVSRRNESSPFLLDGEMGNSG